MLHTWLLAATVTAVGCSAGAPQSAPPQIESTANALVVNYPPGGLIKSIGISDGAPCAGRPVLVQVTASDDADPAAPVQVWVDGAPGNLQVVQPFAAVPTRTVRVFAQAATGKREQKETTISVQHCPAIDSTLELLAHKNPYHPARVDYRAVLRGRAKARAFQWFFGDGTQATTTVPFVSHDYGNKVLHGQRYTEFSAFVIETRSNLLTGRRVAIGSTVAASRALGWAEAEVRTTVTKTGTGFAVGIDVRNHEAEPIVFDRYLKHYLPCDTTAQPNTQDVPAEAVLGTGVTVVRPPGVHAPGAVTIPAGGRADTRITLPLDNIPPETCALGFNLVGRAGRRKAYGSFYLTVRRNPLLTKAVTDKATLKALAHVVKNNQVANADFISSEEMYLLEQKQVIERTSGGWRRAR